MSAYTLYDYTNKIWANIKCENTSSTGLTTTSYWTWIPRYAYLVSSDGKSVDIKYLNTSNQYYNGDTKTLSSLASTYTVHPAFNQDGTQQGIWMSKYEPSKATDGVVDNNNLSPSIDGYDENNTYIMAYASDGNTYKKIKLSIYKELFSTGEDDTEYSERKVAISNSSGDTIKDESDKTLLGRVVETKDESGNITQSKTLENSEIYYIYDYANKIWANIECTNTSSEGITTTTWWTWVPRYAYRITGGNTAIGDKEVEILFVDTNDIPFDDRYSVLPANYTVHPAFNQDSKLRGIWMSKYEPSVAEATPIYITSTDVAYDENVDLVSEIIEDCLDSTNGTISESEIKDFSTIIRVTYYNSSDASSTTRDFTSFEDFTTSLVTSSITKKSDGNSAKSLGTYTKDGKTYQSHNYIQNSYPTIQIIQSWKVEETKTNENGETATVDVPNSNTVTLKWSPRVATRTKKSKDDSGNNTKEYDMAEKVYVDTSNNVLDASSSVYEKIIGTDLTTLGFSVSDNFSNTKVSTADGTKNTNTSYIYSDYGYWTISNYNYNKW
jgi:hypothetical protein